MDKLLWILLAFALLGCVSAPPANNEVSFRADDGLEMQGTMLTPESSGPNPKHPAVLLIPGSGPTDRDGNQPGLSTDLLKQIAEDLQAAGIASYRFDKRATARYQSHWPKDPSKLSDYFSWDRHVADLKAAYAMLKVRPEVDPDRIAIVGHSEGGMYALTLAPIVKPRAIVAIGAPGRPFSEMLSEQLRKLATLQGAPVAMVDAIIAEQRLIDKQLMETGTVPEKIHPGLRALYNPTALSLVRSYLKWDGINALGDYSGPVLVMNGERDLQISAENDAQVLFEKLREPKELAIIPKASHNLKVGGPGDPTGFKGPVAEEAMVALRKFLGERLK